MSIINNKKSLQKKTFKGHIFGLFSTLYVNPITNPGNENSAHPEDLVTVKGRPLKKLPSPLSHFTYSPSLF